MENHERVKIAFGIFSFEAENPTIIGVTIVFLVLVFIIIVVHKTLRKNVKPAK